MRNGWGSINFYKSTLIFLGDILAKSFLISLIFNCPIKRVPILCLGFPLSIGSLRRSQWLPLIEKVQRRLTGWKGRLLSLGERITMVDTVLYAISTYFLSFFQLPRWVEKDIDSIMRKFLWNRGNVDIKGFSLVNWKCVCKRKEFGGLGVINLRDFNRALLLKWWQRLFLEPGWKWASLISHNYGPRSGWWSGMPANSASSSSFWKGMLSVKDIFFQATAKEIRNGRTTQFWRDKWCSTVPLGVLFLA